MVLWIYSTFKSHYHINNPTFPIVYLCRIILLILLPEVVEGVVRIGGIYRFKRSIRTVRNIGITMMAGNNRLWDR